MEARKETCEKLHLKIRLEERVKKIVKWITQIRARLDGTEVDPIGRGMNWQDCDYDLAYKIPKQIRAGYGWRKILHELTDAERRRLSRMEIESDDSS